MGRNAKPHGGSVPIAVRPQRSSQSRGRFAIAQGSPVGGKRQSRTGGARRHSSWMAFVYVAQVNGAPGPARSRLSVSRQDEAQRHTVDTTKRGNCRASRPSAVGERGCMGHSSACRTGCEPKHVTRMTPTEGRETIPGPCVQCLQRATRPL